ncbi:PREDICTED: E3 ubiquitin-protein ligase UHRF1-like [Ceratosolen solmsi marchali]|uniref:RING-type E3 ubiquitin transferase n=1 Tax=Ceratosolen solmsi marchali TaxID=326594 RepID=A0AAJ6YSC2_9HYME|nr:PREDICTED: E3 ubiquitin-protein ligase UHRF1-like [Ceratosolen solmsi marchali]
MYVQVVTIDGKKKTVLNVSKLTKIKDLKNDIEQEFGIKWAQQGLFFCGKHLEDDCTLYDYSININNVIQVMIKSKQEDLIIKNKGKEMRNDEPMVEKTKDEINVKCKYYKVGDAIDCTDNALGAWFEALILKIFTKFGKLMYKVKWDLPDSKDDEPFDVDATSIRPRAWRILNFNHLDVGKKVMVNYNLENSSEIGNWYDFTILKTNETFKELIGTVHIGDGTRSVENCTVNTKFDIYMIEKPVLLMERDDDFITSHIPTTRRKIPFKCSNCLDNPKKKCRECSCKICGKKNDPHLTLLCDECDDAYHMACLNPPLMDLPTNDDWYCPDCKVNANEIVKFGEKIIPKKKHSNVVGSNRDWGKGMACVGRTKICTIVPLSHRGPIPGIEVGTLWKFRVQVSEAGVHRPHVAGIHGRADDCAYSIVLSGGYEDDLDNGEEFLYTGSGGRDLSGNKRTAKQSCDQQLTLMNRALALNCNARVNVIEGAEAINWKAGLPIRVVRNFKLAKHSKYAPEDGNRYDGIYKVVKYWPEKGQSGFRVWRYLLRRDDPISAPWTKLGKIRIAQFGLEMIYPEGYQEAQEKKARSKRKFDDNVNSVSYVSTQKKQKTAFKVSNEITNLIIQDSSNAKLWSQCNDFKSQGKQAYFEKVSMEFSCIVCQDLVFKPVTTPCAHNICIACLKRSFEVNTYACPMCRTSLDKSYKMLVNEKLSSILLSMFPGYDKTR